MKVFVLIFTLMFSASVSAQVALVPIKQVGPASYPPAARAVRATGQVAIDLSIDNEGNVVTAKAISGHPLLRAASEHAVRFWKYEKVAIDSPIRPETVYLEYSADIETKLIPESAEASETVTETDFSGPTYGKVRLVELIPRLLRLPRKDGIVESHKCSLHGDELIIELARFSCSDVLNDKFVPPDGYLDSLSELFPFASSPDRIGCGNEGIELKEIRYCANCRIARNNWLQINTE